MNYKIKPTETPQIFTLEDPDGHPVADVRGLDLAEQFAALPEIVAAMQDLMDEQNGPPLMRREKQYFDAYERCNVILGKFNSAIK